MCQGERLCAMLCAKVKGYVPYLYPQKYIIIVYIKKTEGGD